MSNERSGVVSGSPVNGVERSAGNFSAPLTCSGRCQTCTVYQTLNYRARWEISSPSVPLGAPSYLTDDCCLVTDARQEDCHSYASRQSDAHQLRRKSLQCIWPSRLELSVDGPQTAGLVIQPFQTVAEDTFIWSVYRTKAKCEPPHLNCTLEIILLTYFVSYLLYI